MIILHLLNSSWRRKMHQSHICVLHNILLCLRFLSLQNCLLKPIFRDVCEKILNLIHFCRRETMLDLMLRIIHLIFVDNWLNFCLYGFVNHLCIKLHSHHAFGLRLAFLVSNLNFMCRLGHMLLSIYRFLLNRFFTRGYGNINRLVFCLFFLFFNNRNDKMEFFL